MAIFQLIIMFFISMHTGYNNLPGITPETTHVDLKQNNEADFAIIPIPVSITPGIGYLNAGEIAIYSFNTQPAGDPSLDFRNWLNKYWNRSLRHASKSDELAIHFVHSDTISRSGAYVLEINPDCIRVIYNDEAGAFYATQSLKQLFPIEHSEVGNNDIQQVRLPIGTIYDYPRFAYRGMHMDDCRHFFGMEAVKQYIDMLAFQKMNYFHWHLTDDQGWRIEIKKYPRLAQVAACRDETLIGHFTDRPIRYDGQQYCHIYTQEECREIVRYAAERYITVIPEIEMPGHATAAIAAYPELSCHGQQVKTQATWGVFYDIFCPTEATFTFLENVLSEVIEIFPSKMIHIGGDEVPKNQWKESEYCQQLIRKNNLKDENGLQSYFIHRIEQFLNAKGRTIIGWDEILEGGLAPNAVVMSWRGMAGGLEAALQGHKVIMAPGTHCYFDHYQSREPGEPIAIGGYTSLAKVYNFDPIPPELPADKHKFILGGQANLWAEYILSTAHLQYMAYPRSFALSESLWSPLSKKDYNDFLHRLKYQIRRLDSWGINYSKHLYNINIRSIYDNGQLRVHLKSDGDDMMLQYRMHTGKQTMVWQNYKELILLENDAQLEARLIDPVDQKVWTTLSKRCLVHKVSGKMATLVEHPDGRYATGGSQALTNGILGSDKSFADSEWLGFLGKDVIATFDLGLPTRISKCNLRFYLDPESWIHGPRSVEVFGSNDGHNFSLIGSGEGLARNSEILTTAVHLPGEPFRYVRVKVVRHGIITDGLPGQGREAWLFMDEIDIR